MMHDEKLEFIKERFFHGYCPDLYCNERLLFTTNIINVFCHYCGQRFHFSKLNFISKINREEALLTLQRIDSTRGRQGFEWTRINGASPFLCKLISTVFAVYGVTRDWKPKLLADMGINRLVVSKLLGNRCYEIDEIHLKTTGFGRDSPGSYEYLKDTLDAIQSFRESNILEPLTVCGEGDCLTMAVSRALVGREVFWQTLRVALSHHMDLDTDWYENYMDEFLVDQDLDKVKNHIAFNLTYRTDRLNLHSILILRGRIKITNVLYLS